MFGLFNKKCNHPANSLVVYKDATVENIDEDFNKVTYHLQCSCGEMVDIKYAKMIGGVDGFMERGRQKMMRGESL